MKSSDRTILIAIGVLGVLAAAWFMVISPKRDDVAKLDEEITAVRTSLQEQEQMVAVAQEAKEEYNTDYRDLVVLGKAVPEEENTSSLFVELEALGQRSGVALDSIELNSAPATAPPPPPAAETTTDENAEDASSADGATTPASPVATEATAALLPIGATIGPAGLPVMPYTIQLTGDFFQISDFLAGVDALVKTQDSGPVADGRLLTIDGFELVSDATEGSETLDAMLSVTTYVSPADQGLTGGATPAAPAPATPATTTSTAMPAATGTPTP